jgi:hypothetical protein
MGFTGRVVIGFLLGLILQSLELMLFLFRPSWAVQYFGAIQVLYIAPVAYVLHRRAEPGYSHGLLIAGTVVAFGAAWLWFMLAYAERARLIRIFLKDLL